MSDTEIRFFESSPIEECKFCMVAVPDVGLVASIALNYIVHEQAMEEIGHVESEYFPPVIVVHRGSPKHPLRLYAKGEVAAILSEIPLEPGLTPPLSRSIVDWATSKNAELIISLSGIAVQNRLEIDVPEVYAIPSKPSVKSIIEDMGVKIFEEGFLAGLHANLMKECLKRDVPNVILLAQSHLRYPDPGAAASLVSSLNKLIDGKVDTAKLLAQEDEIRLRMRELMQRTQRQMRQSGKEREQEIPLMYT